MFRLGADLEALGVPVPGTDRSNDSRPSSAMWHKDGLSCCKAATAQVGTPVARWIIGASGTEGTADRHMRTSANAYRVVRLLHE